jgi:hypothetical protein
MLCFHVIATHQSRSSLLPPVPLLPSPPSTLFFSEACSLTYATAASHLFAYQSLPNFFGRDGGCTRHSLQPDSFQLPLCDLPVLSDLCEKPSFSFDFRLSALKFQPSRPLSPLECAVPKNAPITPLECAVPKTRHLKSFRMRRSEKRKGDGGKLLTRSRRKVFFRSHQSRLIRSSQEAPIRA